MLEDVDYGNGVWVAVGQNGTVIRSTDAVRWERVQGIENGQGALEGRSFYGIQYLNGIWIAVGESGIIYTSTDGQAWINRHQSNNGPALRAISLGKNEGGGPLYVAVGEGEEYFTSANGLNWNAGFLSSNWGLTDIAYGNGRFLAISDQQPGELTTVFESVYGEPFTDTTEFPERVSSLIFTDDQFAATSANSNRIYFAANGLNWTSEEVGPDSQFYHFRDADYDSTLDELTLIGRGLNEQGLAYGRIGNNGWVTEEINSFNLLNAVAINSTNAVAVGNNGSLFVKGVKPSTDNTLLSLELSGATLTDGAFASDRFSYLASAESRATSVTVTARTNYEGAALEINGFKATSGQAFPVALNGPGQVTAVSIKVTPQDPSASPQVYTVNIQQKDDSGLSALTMDKGMLYPAFSNTRMNYRAEVNSEVDTVRITPTAVNTESDIRLTINDGPEVQAASGVSSEIPLREGENQIAIKVTSPFTNVPNPKIYFIYVFREPSAYLQNLEVDAGELRPVFKRDVNEYNVYVTPDTNKIEIRPTAESERAVITVNGQQTVSGSVYTAQLQEGPNDIRIVVTNDSLPPARMKSGEANVLAVQNQQVYTVVVHRAAREPNARLANLAIDPGTLAPAFDPERTDYTATVTNDVYNLEVAASAIDPEAVVTVRGSAIEEGSARIVPLTVGANEIDVVVNAGGETTRTYKITVTRQAAAVDPGPGPVIPIPDFTPTPTPTPTTPAPTTPTTPADGLEVIVNGQPTTIVATGGTSQSNGQTVFTATIDTARLAAQLTSGGANQSVIIPVRTQADRVIATLTGEAVNLLGSNQATLRLETPLGNYTLPSSQLRLSAAAGTLGTPADSADLDVNITIQASGADVQNALSQAAASEGFTSVSTPLDFMITASNGERNVEVNNFTQYVEREIPIPAGIDPNRITTGVVIEPNGTVRHVPTAVTQTGGTYYAEVNSLTNSSYVLIWNPEQFADVAGKWSQSAVNDMASRLVVNGVGEDRFNPEGAVTRAEFAAILVRALGLPGTLQTAGFSDVASGQWYAEAAATADQYGLIAGYPDGTFRPNATITRQEAFTVLNRAAQIAPLRLPGTGSELGSYRDRADVADWATDAAESLLAAGLVEGSGGWLRPEATLSRAESAAVAQRLLRQASLIDQ
nr:cadherin-like beta sandwich domain-containing protein [Saccharibacillus brassicae]